MIAHHEGAWWSLMVLRARSYDRLAQRLKAIEDAAEGPRLRGGAAAPQMAVAASGVPWDNESCLSNSPSAKPPLSDAPDGNHGDNQTITVAKWYQTDTIRQSWQLPSGSRPKSKPSQKPTASGSESPSTPSLASRLTPIYNGQSLPAAERFGSFIGWLQQQDEQAALSMWVTVLYCSVEKFKPSQ